MADYYPLITRAVAGLDKNSGEGRRALYERARTALVDQLRGVSPALSESDITRERLALEEAIRKVESEQARKPRDFPLPGSASTFPTIESLRASHPPPPSPRAAAADDRLAHDRDRDERDGDDRDGGDRDSGDRNEDARPDDDRDALSEARKNDDASAASESDAPADRPPPPEPSWSSRPAAGESAPPVTSRRDPFRRDAPPPFQRTPPEPRPETPRADLPRQPPIPGRSLRDRGSDGGLFRSRGLDPGLFRRGADGQPKNLDGEAKGLGGVVDEVDDLGAAAKAAKSARDRYGGGGAPPGEERAEPRFPTPDRNTPRRRPVDRRPPAPPADADLGPEIGSEDTARPRHRGAAGRQFDAPPPEGRRFERAGARDAEEADLGERGLAGRIGRGAVRFGIIAAVVLAIGGGAYLMRHAILDGVRGAISMVRGSPTTPATPSRPSDPQRTKIPDRIGTQDASQPATTRPDQPAEAPVAQRVVLYEEDPNEPSGKRTVGTAIWRTEMVSPGPGQPADRQVRADISIPDRNMQITWTLRRNNDKELPASHTVAIMFTVPANFDHGGIQEIRGVLMKAAEQARGTSLSGLAVKVTTGYFLIGLSSADQDIQKNVQLLKERGWLDVAIVYNDGRRAILAMEKGTPGERAFQSAFNAWGQ